jgi:hypothetical protein
MFFTGFASQGSYLNCGLTSAREESKSRKAGVGNQIPGEYIRNDTMFSAKPMPIVLV